MKNILFTAIAGLMFCGNALADRWEWASTNSDRNFAELVNTDSIECEGKTCTGWVASIIDDPKETFDLLQDFMQVDCKQMKKKYLYSAAFMKDKLVETIAPDVTFEFMVPNTLEYRAAQFICKKLKSNKVFEGSAFDLVKPVRKALRQLRNEPNKI